MHAEFERIKSLLEGIGIRFTEDGLSNAEIYAYSSALEALRKKIYAGLCEVFFTLNNASSLEKYTELLNIDASRLTRSEIKEHIIARLSQPYGYAAGSLMQREFEEIGSGSYETEDGRIVFDGIERNDLPRLGKFLKAFGYIGLGFAYAGSGLTFDEWDEWGLTFDEYDNLSLPFGIIDTLRR